MSTVRLLALAAAVILASCAGTTPDAAFTQPLSDAIARGDRVKTTVASSDSRMLEVERQRLSEKVTREVTALAAPGGTTPRSYEIAVAITRYDKGDAFARAMLAGLGQIHIDGKIAIYQMPGRKKAGEFNLNKTFAWGGIYGASVSMETIEDTYAKAIAEAVCGAEARAPAR